MNNFDFDEQIDRRAVPALKTHRIVLGEGGQNLFAAGVADMDFSVAPAILSALQTRLSHPIFGYEAVPDGLFPALQDWQERRHGWTIATDHILRVPNALTALAIAASIFSDPGDGIIVQPPVFFDFFDVIAENDRKTILNPLTLRDGRYEMNLEGLERVAQDPSTKILFLCNPHNPVGRVWSLNELQSVADICCRHNVLIVSDELHGDLVYSGNQHIPIASLGNETAANSITILSPAKSFNIAGCCSAFCVIPDVARRTAFQRESSRLTVNKNNVFANVAMETAYRQAGPWLDAAISYLQGNLTVLREHLARINRVHMIEPEATFLVWLDFRDLGLSPVALHNFLREEVHWAVTRGVSFGQDGAGFVRLNFACPRARLTAALDDLARVLGRSE